MKGTIFAVALNHRSQLDAWQDALPSNPPTKPRLKLRFYVFLNRAIR